jgi:hypothetical protein
MIKQITISFLFLSIFLSCSSQKRIVVSSQQIKQGISGQVFELSGNFMPSPDSPNANYEGTPMKTKVAVFTVLNNASMQKKNGMFVNMESQSISEVLTNEKGEFFIALDEGSYSVLIKLPNGYYANRYDEKMNINVVTVKKDSLTNVKMKFDLNAVY